MAFIHPTLTILALLSAGRALAQVPTTAPAAPVSSPDAAAKEPLDYVTLSHTLSIDSLRAGSHDASGSNDYFFTVVAFGLLNSAEERNMAFEARKKLTVELGTFGDTVIDSLAVWKPDEKLKNYKEFKIDGNVVRELAARTMKEFAVQEAEISVMVEVAMHERNKRFIFFGEDVAVAKVAYYPIPATKFDAPIRANQSLAITDNLGTLVKVSVKYGK